MHVYICRFTSCRCCCGWLKLPKFIYIYIYILCIYIYVCIHICMCIYADSQAADAAADG